MHILKFVQDTEPPTEYFITLYETIGFVESGYVSESSTTLSETIGFRDVVPGGISEICYETIGFNYSNIFGFDIQLEETLGFNDGSDESLVVYIAETIGWSDTNEWELGDSVIIAETIGFGLSGFNYITDEHDITFTWRTRTKDAATGYGATGYGVNVSYGDGDATGYSSFEIHIWKVGGAESNRYLDTDPANEFDDRLTKQTITIADVGDPDANASYTLTVANNKSYNGGEFLYEMEAEVFVKDSNGVYSFGKMIVLEGDGVVVPHSED